MEKLINNYLEIRQLDNSCLLVSCKVNDYGISKTLRGINGAFKEQIKKEVWQKAIKENKGNIKVFYNHQDIINVADKVDFRVEDDGIYADITLSDKAEGLYTKIKNKEVTGMSFGMKVIKDTFTNVGNFLLRTIEDFHLLEVSFLSIEPAYFNTTAEVRSINIPIDINIKRNRLNLYKLS